MGQPLGSVRCYHPGGVHFHTNHTPVTPSSQSTCTASDLAARSAAVTAECCDEPTEDCSSGQPATCNLGCAAVLVPYYQDCQGALQGDAEILAAVQSAVQQCRFGSRGFEQPPYGYPQYDESEGKFSDGSRYVCVCASTDSPADPVHKDQIPALTQAGTITNHTMVWSEGLADWMRFDHARDRLTADSFQGTFIYDTGAYDSRTSFGQDCSSQGDFCGSSPCQNGAACVTSQWSYTCNCPGGWTGLNCEAEEHATPLVPMAGTSIRALASFDMDGVVGSIEMHQDAADPTAETTVVVYLTGLQDSPNPWVSEIRNASQMNRSVVLERRVALVVDLFGSLLTLTHLVFWAARVDEWLWKI